MTDQTDHQTRPGHPTARADLPAIDIPHLPSSIWLEDASAAEVDRSMLSVQ